MQKKTAIFLRSYGNYIDSQFDYLKGIETLGTDNLDYDQFMTRLSEMLVCTDEDGRRIKLDHKVLLKLAGAFCVEAVCQGIGGANASPVMVAIQNRKVILSLPPNVWRGREANEPIDPDTVTKRRVIKVGALLHYALKGAGIQVKEGFYKKNYDTKEDFTLGYEFVISDGAEIPGYLEVVFRACRMAVSGRHDIPGASELPLSVTKRAYLVIRRRLKGEAPPWGVVLEELKSIRPLGRERLKL